MRKRERQRQTEKERTRTRPFEKKRNKTKRTNKMIGKKSSVNSWSWRQKENNRKKTRVFNENKQKKMTYCLHKQKESKMANSFFFWQWRFLGRHREMFSCKAMLNFHCYSWHCFVVFDVVLVQQRQQEAENRLNLLQSMNLTWSCWHSYWAMN